jgi:dolichol-phosphate mannosyltransferase
MDEKISLVVPLFNEEEIIDQLYERCINALSSQAKNFEIICVDDGSRDKTLERLKTYHQKDPRFKILSFSRNFGHQPAVFAGLTYAGGEYIMVIDGDLQDPPELVGEFLKKAREGYDVVYAVRKKRKEGFVKKTAYWLFYRFLKNISSTEIPLDSGDFCMMRKKVVDQLLQMNEQALFIRGLRAWVGFSQACIEYERDGRQTGQTKYSLKKLLDLAYRGIFSFSHVPIKLFSRLGQLVVSFSFLYLVYILIKKIFFGDVPQGFTTLVLFMSIFSGIILLGIGMLGEYVTRIYDEVRNRPLFIVKEKYIDESK